LPIYQALLFGLLQGITEFLPVSSSGHLMLAERLLGQPPPLFFDVCLHMATLCATILFFRRQVADLLGAAKRLSRRIIRADTSGTLLPEDRTLLALIAGTGVTALAALTFKKILPDRLPSVWVFAGFILTAALLIAGGRTARRAPATGGTKSPAVTIRQGLIIGLVQGIGVLPGISRSGSTISAAIFTGLDRQRAGEFSFMLSLPAIAGAFVLELRDAGALQVTLGPGALAAGMLAAFVSGLVSLRLLMGLIRRGRLEWFALYLLPLGIAGLLFWR
jgi:undecaprenyl-diphosphatase